MWWLLHRHQLSSKLSFKHLVLMLYNLAVSAALSAHFSACIVCYAVLYTLCLFTDCKHASYGTCRAWQQLTRHQDVGSIAIACIGSTTAIAAQKQGFRHVYFPEQPGIDGFVVSITDALTGSPGRVLTA